MRLLRFIRKFVTRIWLYIELVLDLFAFDPLAIYCFAVCFMLAFFVIVSFRRRPKPKSCRHCGALLQEPDNRVSPPSPSWAVWEKQF